MPGDPRNPSGPVAVAMAEAAARRAAARLERLRERGEVVADEADFVAREVQQAFMDMAKSRRCATTA